MSNPSALVFDDPLGCWLSFGAPSLVLSADDLNQVVPVLRQAQDAVKECGLWSIGWLAYEAAAAFDPALGGSDLTKSGSTLPLAWFGLYSEPRHLDRLPPPVTFDSESRPCWEPEMTEIQYRDAFSEVRRSISRGDSYQVNLSFRLRAKGIQDPYALFYRMVSEQAGRYSFFVDAGRYAICSASPELFFAFSSGEIVCKPMKGTAKRVGNPESDNAAIFDLSSSSKERAENVMIVDMVRNDLSRVALDHSVHVPYLCQVERFPGIFQMVSEVHASTKASLVDVVAALFPSASITGAPKARTMEIIRLCESSPRGLYTGSLGIISPDDRAWFNVAIRTAVVDQSTGTAEYGVGSGVVWDSECHQEYRECLLKAQVIERGQVRPALFETLLWKSKEGYWLLDYHLERLAQSALFFGYTFNKARVRQRMEDAIAASAIERCAAHDALRVKIILDSLGALATEVTPISVTVTPYRVALAKEYIRSDDLRLFHKTTDRSIYEGAVPIIPGVDDVLLWNERGEVTESRIANLIVSLNGKLFTPPVSSGVLPGCLRRDLLERGEVSERVITIAEIGSIDEVYLANSLRGVWKVELYLA
jgi:para-aminobenzoate synthetase/4-amino-4-deoxychorismate lyase